MVPITELAQLVRSKNAGPFVISIDLIFLSQAVYEQIVASAYITPESIADLYQVPISRVISIVEYPPARAIKINLRRVLPAGSFGERDGYGSQQHSLLDSLLIPDASSSDLAGVR